MHPSQTPVTSQRGKCPTRELWCNNLVGLLHHHLAYEMLQQSADGRVRPTPTHTHPFALASESDGPHAVSLVAPQANVPTVAPVQPPDTGLFPVGHCNKLMQVTSPHSEATLLFEHMWLLNTLTRAVSGAPPASGLMVNVQLLGRPASDRNQHTK